MILFPAIDLKNGEAVRLEQGDMARATVFNRDPAAQARAFAGLGFEWLHLVDLDGAFAGKPVNALAVAAILKAVKIPVQLGGGIRSLGTVEAWLGEGVARVILGTAAVRDPDFVKAAARKYPGKIAVGIDARAARWRCPAGPRRRSLRRSELARLFEDNGIAAIVYTDVERDGMLKGLNLGCHHRARGGRENSGDRFRRPRFARRRAGAVAAAREKTRRRRRRPRAL